MTKTKTKMKIYIEASSLTTKHLSGVGHVLLSTLRAWDINDKSIVLVVPYNKKATLAKWGLPFTVKALPLPDRVFRALRKFNLLPWLDVFIGKGIYVFPNYWNWPVLRSKIVTYVHDLGYITHPEFLEEKNRKFLLRHGASWLKRSDRVVAVSEFTRDELVSLYPDLKDRVCVVHNGVDLAFFAPANSETIAEVKKRYDIVGNYILFVSNIEPRKNIVALLDAYDRLSPQTQKTYSLILVGGDGWRNEEVFARIKTLQGKGLNVRKIERFVPDEDLPALYSGASVLALTSTYEGFGITPLEAMATKTAVVVSDIAPLREVVGSAGVYVNPTDLDDISDKIETLLADSSVQDRLREAGRSGAQQFSWKRSVDELTDCLSRLKGVK